MRNVKKLFFLGLALLVTGALFAATADISAVQQKVMGKVPVQGLQINTEGGKVVLSGTVATLKDKYEVEKIVAKELKARDITNNIEVAPVEKTDEQLTVDVVAQIKHDAPRDLTFDSIQVATHGGFVSLMGKVRNAYLHDVAEEAAMKVKGVRGVENHIEILPPSANDDRLRGNILRKLRSDDRLFYYFMGAQPSINIIVEGSRVTLTGYVDTEADKILAGTLVRQMPGVLSVDNQLQVD